MHGFLAGLFLGCWLGRVINCCGNEYFCDCFWRVSVVRTLSALGLRKLLSLFFEMVCPLRLLGYSCGRIIHTRSICHGVSKSFFESRRLTL